MFFITVGLASGCFGHKYKQSVLESCTTEASPSSTSSGEAGVSRSEQVDAQNLEMLENIVYVHLPSTKYIAVFVMFTNSHYTGGIYMNCM